MLFNETRQSGKDQGLFIKSKLFALMVRCPLSKTPSKSCPLNSYRNGASLEEKYSTIENLDEINRLHLLALHNRCFELQTGNFFRFNHANCTRVDNEKIQSQL